ncbi:hypothetical protein K435DRAFT_811157 [Dendrothele bispora CBS 962.96]|uniref:Uncharacterized protein n=1 Tax=Dendrothele bispora (strain CBS 962.96) TaxID=1314807 RepID=A0A4S8KT55_DENBC|nr:hypothetical protein K435DRAFT_811157 [Dendrothele bispora CBS 962.96]
MQRQAPNMPKKTRLAKGTPQFASRSRRRKESIGFSDENDVDPNGVDDDIGFNSVPATSDGEGLTSQDEQEDIEEFPPPKSKRPIVTSAAATTTAATQAASTQPSSDPNTAPVWLPRTEIILKPYTDATRSFAMAMHGQIPEMKAVIRLAQKIGPVKMGLEAISIASLIEAAEELGYDGEGDIAHRMENGDMDKYIKPLKGYVAHGIGMERTDIKKPFSSVVLVALGLDDSPEGVYEAGELN